jgi:hypothetical protein
VRTANRTRPGNLARFKFLDPHAHGFFLDRRTTLTSCRHAVAEARWRPAMANVGAGLGRRSSFALPRSGETRPDERFSGVARPVRLILKKLAVVGRPRETVQCAAILCGGRRSDDSGWSGS